MAVTSCATRATTRIFQSYDYMCLGHNKDGTEAWRYAADVRGFGRSQASHEHPHGQRIRPAKQNTLVPGTDVDVPQSFLDGSVHGTRVRRLRTLTPVTDVGVQRDGGADDSEAPPARDNHRGRH